ncbi:MAG: hypothetical protein E7329_07265 [Clostridiales bacterium]|nr:hypothetical protein [Clostridiales bacterium]
MIFFKILNAALTLYALAQLLHFALPFIVSAQQPWMVTLAKICEPGEKVGNQVASRLLKNRRFQTDIGAPVAAILCWIIKILMGLFLW